MFSLANKCTEQKGVVKLIRPESPYKTTPRFSISTDLFRKRVEMEIYAGKTLDHPNICRMYDFWVGDSEAYLLFEFIEGNQLLDIIIQHGKISHRKIRKWCKQLLSALDHCHTHRIAHRDLNVENIMITPKGNLKLIDFGVCCKFDPETKLQEPCGRPWYAAPEIYCNSGYIGPEIDIWSFGVLLYTLVCHKLPFDDESVEGIIEKIKKGQFQLPKHLSWGEQAYPSQMHTTTDHSAELKDLISRILVVDPSRRANLKEIISHPWLNK